METLKFLKLILPGQGYYIGLAKKGEQRRQRVASTIEELIVWLQEFSAAGWDVYHAPACFLHARGTPNAQTGKLEHPRGQANCAGVASLFCDADTQETHANVVYENRVVAWDATAAFVAAIRIPAPLCVDTGGGLQPYWPLDEILDRATWTRLATALKLACLHHKFHVDARVTANCSAVLRTPGFLHQRARRLATVGDFDTRYSVKQFLHLLEEFPPDGYVDRTKQLLVVKPVSNTPIAAALKDANRDSDSDPATLVRNCTQLRRVVDRPRECREPVHRLAAGVFKNIGERGEQFYLDHLDPEWRAEGRGKLDRWLTGPPWCVSFELENPGGCAGCPFFDGSKKGLDRFQLKSAIHAGRIIARERTYERVDDRVGGHSAPPESAPENGAGHEAPEAQTQSSYSGPTRAFAQINGHKHSGSPFEILSEVVVPEGFKFETATGRLVIPTEDEDGNYKPTIVSHHPIYLEGIYKSEMGTAFGRTYAFRQWLPHEGWVPISIPAGDVQNMVGLSAITNGGANVLDSGQFRRFVQGSVDKMNAMHAQSPRYEQCGWKNDRKAWLTGSTLLTAGDVTHEVIVNDELNTRAPLLGPVQGTDFTAWRESVKELLPEYDHSGRFALLVSLGSIFMSWLHPHESGCVLNLRDISSGTGKTMRLQCASSAWGRWHGLRITNNDTEASQSYKRAVLCNLPVFHDELVDEAVTDDPAKLAAFLKQRTEGKDKDRMQGGGKGLQHQAGQHQNIEITASNYSVWEHVRAFGRGSDAPIMRCLEITSQPTTHLTANQISELQRVMWDNSGWAGQMFVQWVLNNMDYARNMVRYWNDYIIAHTNLEQKHRFWIRVIVCAAVAGAVSEAMGALLPISDYRQTIDWVLNDIDALSGKQRAEDSATGGNGEVALGDFIAANIRNTLPVHGPFMAGSPPLAPLRVPDKLVMRAEQTNQRLLFAKDSFRKFCSTHGFSYVDCIRHLKSVKLLINDNKHISLGAGTTVPSVRQWCLEIDMAHPSASQLPRLVLPEGDNDREQEHRT